MREFSNDIVDLVIADPPYNIKKVEWDKWESLSDYINFMGSVFKEIEKVLKFVGSFYLFHNDFTQLSKLHLWIEKNTKFIYQNLIIWNKRFEKSKNKAYLDGFIVVNGLRKYQQMAEYILFYTFGADVNLSIDNFKELRQYFKELQMYLKLSKNEIIEIIGQEADHCFRWSSLQWELPTEATYNKLIKNFKIDKWKKFKTYSELKLIYEKSRYVFNNQKTHHSVWNYDFVDKKIGHITPKPVALIENILKHSSNESSLVLDPFLGSGTTAVACEKLNRKWVGIEINPEYCKIAKERILQEATQKRLF